jgi:DNA-binding NarL/FixJ family response regulator
MVDAACARAHTTKIVHVSASVPIRVIAIDDHPLFREGIATAIGAYSDLSIAGVAGTAAEGLALYRTVQPDVVLMDLRLPDRSGIDALIAIRAEFRDARVIMLSTFHGDVEIQRSLSAGARGFLVKSIPPHELIDAIRQVYAGKRCVPPVVAAQLAEYLTDDALTPRESGVLQLLAKGNRNQDIADQLSITEETVKVHVKHILEKLGAADRTEAVVIGVRRGIIHL